jgi:hypothetical protein
MKHFGDIETITPGTIGAFCYGCHNITGFSGTKSCSATCIGSIPTPDMPNWIDCDSNVFLLYPSTSEKRDDTTPLWRDVQTVGYDKLSYVFIISDEKDKNEISGLEELMRLKGITKYSLYSLKSGVYKHINTGKIGKTSAITKWGSVAGKNQREVLPSGSIIPGYYNSSPGHLRRTTKGKDTIISAFFGFMLLIIIIVFILSNKKRKNH